MNTRMMTASPVADELVSLDETDLAAVTGGSLAEFLERFFRELDKNGPIGQGPGDPGF